MAQKKSRKSSSQSAKQRSSRQQQDVSNKTVLALLLATLAVSLGGTFISLSTINERLSSAGLAPITGFALVPNGTATLTVESTASIRFIADTVAFGTGSVDTANGYNNCTLSTLPWQNDANGGNSGCTTFNNLSNGFTIENDGNTNLTVELRSNRTASEFIGAGSAMFKWNVTINETGSCVNSSGSRSIVEPNTTDAVTCGGATTSAGHIPECGDIFENVTTSDKIICPSLRYEEVNDALNIDINITIPVDAPTGDKLAGLVVTGTTQA